MNRIVRNTLLGASLLIVSTSGYAQKFGTRVDVTAIEVSASVRDASGHLPRDLKPGDFELLEDGKPQRIIGVTYNLARPPAETIASDATEPPPEPPRPRQIVVFLQQSLSMTDGLRLSLKSLAPQAGKLVAMGDVEVVTDDPSPHSLLGPTRDESALRALFEKLGNEAEGKEELIRTRMEFTTGDQMTSDQDDRLTRRYLVRKAARHEWVVLRRRQDAMLAWLSRYGRHASGDATRVLVFVTDGFDLAPAGYYPLDGKNKDLRTDLRTELREMNASTHEDDIARALAAQGWTIVSFAPGWRVNRVTHFTPTTHDPYAVHQFVDVVGNVRHGTMNRAPLDPLYRLAGATGGSVLTDPSKLGDRLGDLDQRVVITYQVDRPSDDKLRHVEIRSMRAGLTVNAQKWVGSGSTEAMTEATAEAMATAAVSGDFEEQGTLPVTCSIKLGPNAKGVRTSAIEVHVNLATIEGDLASIESGSLRFTLAVLAPGAPPFTSTNRLEHLDFSARQEWTSTMSVRHRDGAKMAVIAEESSTGAWGGCRIVP